LKYTSNFNSVVIDVIQGSRCIKVIMNYGELVSRLTDDAA